MILRIVKMSFDPAKVPDFLALFNSQQSQIRNFPGCTHLELWEAIPESNVLFTYSHWASEAALENYRHSTLFAGVWAATKVLFNAKPEAWSVVRKM